MSIGPGSPLILGSSSPRRREILSALGISIEVLPANVPEEIRADEAPLAYIERITQSKLEGVARQFVPGRGAALLVADTIVVLDDEVLGKPADRAEAEHMLRRLTGRTHVVFTRYAMATPDAPDQARRARTVRTEVTLRSASAAEIAGYAATGEGLDKAGAYAAQGIGSFLIERIVGSYSNVVGLPACEVVQDLQQLGLLANFP